MHRAAGASLIDFDYPATAEICTRAGPAGL